MNIQIRYYSKSGNTKKLAEAIAEVSKAEALTVDTPIDSETDILFLGAAVYAYGISSAVKKFINELDPKKVKKVAIFADSALAERVYPSMSKMLKERGIEVMEDNFYCRGRFLHLHVGHPDAEDLGNAKEFAKRVIGL